SNATDNVLACAIQRLLGLLYLLLNIEKKIPLLVNKIVFLYKPHFEQCSIQIIRYFDKSQLCLHLVEIPHRKKAYQQYQPDIDYIGKYDFAFYLHINNRSRLRIRQAEQELKNLLLPA